MGKYLLLWEVVGERVPVDAKERGAGWSALMEMVKQDMKAGLTKDWGAFVGELNGYAVSEGTEVEVGKALTKYAPYVRFKTYPISSVSQIDEVIKSLTG